MKRPATNLEMRARLVASLLLAAVVVAVSTSGCAQSAPTPAATQVPATTGKAAEAPKPTAPEKAAVAPTTAPAKKVDFPTRPISFVVAFSAGGGGDISARTLAPVLEKELGVSVQVINKEGAGGQIGFTEIARSKPDGYTIGLTALPQIITSSLDSARKAVYTRQSFQLLGNVSTMPIVVAVNADSPFKSLKDVIDAAKVNPEKVKMGITGLLGSAHLGSLQLEKQAGVKFATVAFDGEAKAMTAMLGGHLDVGSFARAGLLSQYKAGQVRVLAVLDREESEVLPGAKTAEAQGFKAYSGTMIGLGAPVGMPKEVGDILVAAAKKASQDSAVTSKFKELGYTPLYLDPDRYGSTWADMEKDIQPFMEMSKS